MEKLLEGPSTSAFFRRRRNEGEPCERRLGATGKLGPRVSESLADVIVGSVSRHIIGSMTIASEVSFPSPLILIGPNRKSGNMYKELECSACRIAGGLPFDFSMAFQPIVDIVNGTVYAQEALVRGMAGQPSSHILEQVNDANRYRFDQACRTRAIGLAAGLGMTSLLSINFMPNAVYKPEHCIRTTLAAAEAHSFPVERIIFEVTESEKVNSPVHVKEIMEYYKQQGFLTAIDDFGAGYAGLAFLAEFKPDIVKLDMSLIRNIDRDDGRRAIVRGILQVCRDLQIRPVAEGIETEAEFNVLSDFGIELFQGYYFARPAFEALAEIPAKLLESVSRAGQGADVVKRNQPLVA